MKKLKVIENFTLKDYDKLQEIVRKDKAIIGKLFVDDIIICDDNMADYLLGNNLLNKTVVEDVTPPLSIDIEELPKETKKSKKTTKNKTSKK